MSPDCATHFKQDRPGERVCPDLDFVRLFEERARPRDAWAVGAELELLGYTVADLQRITVTQVQSILKSFAPADARLLKERGYATEVALADGSRITIEPGGQVEYSGAPSASLPDIESALVDYTRRLVEVGHQHGIAFVAAGFDPVRKLEEQNWMPKRRYEIMRPYLGSRGPKAWDMMCRTAAIQANLDYSDLEDLAEKFMVATRFGPIAAAIFANSPFEGAKLSGYKSTRYAVWLETDADRTGPAPLALEGDFSIERFIEYVERVPMIFIRRDGEYVDLAGRSFAEFLRNGATHKPVLQDFTDHLSTIFTEARLKPYIEQRSADCGTVEMAMAALALWKGLMYSREALREALRIAPQLGRGEYAKLQEEVARHGLDARIGGVSVGGLAAAMIELAREGLKAVGARRDPVSRCRSKSASSASAYARPIFLFETFNGSWNGDIRKAVDYLRVFRPDADYCSNMNRNSRQRRRGRYTVSQRGPRGSRPPRDNLRPDVRHTSRRDAGAAGPKRVGEDDDVKADKPAPGADRRGAADRRQALGAWDPIKLRRRIGYVIQETGLFPHFTVERNVALVPRLENWDEDRTPPASESCLRWSGFAPDEFAGRYPRELSGGQRQRVGVARALAVDPPVVLMDEPFGALDPLTRAELQREFARLAARLHKTIVFVTHDIREAFVLASRIGLFKDGRLAVLAAPSEFARSSDPEARAFMQTLSEEVRDERVKG